jgi:DNA-binding SARP family transcriptional activator
MMIMRMQPRPHLVNTTSVTDLATWPVFICLLGGFRLLKSGQQLALRNAEKVSALLANLAMQDHFGASREHLLQTLWPNSQAELAGHALNSLVYNLHKLLGTAIGDAKPVLYSEGQYQLNVEAGIGVDIACFDVLAHEGHNAERAGQLTAAIQTYERAIQLYRGDLCLVSNTQSLILCEALRAQYLTLLARVAEHYFTARDYGSCLAYALQLLAADPCREDAHRAVMRCYVRQGERAQALHQYRVCTAILRSEFNVAPEPATMALYEQIRLDPDSI